MQLKIIRKSDSKAASLDSVYCQPNTIVVPSIVVKNLFVALKQVGDNQERFSPFSTSTSLQSLKEAGILIRTTLYPTLRSVVAHFAHWRG